MRRLIAPSSTLLATLTSLALVPACADKDNSQQSDDQGVENPIPRFPPVGLPGSTTGSTAEPGPDNPLPNPADPLPNPGQTNNSKEHPTTAESGTEGQTQQVPGSSPSTQDQTTQGPEPKPEPRPRPKPKPGEAAFVDWGLFKVATLDAEGLFRSKKRQTTANEHMMTRLGHERVVNDVVGIGVITRRTYGVFDVSQVHDAVGAKLEYYIFATSLAAAGTGGYSSPDPSETVEIHSLDRFSPQEIMDAPFEQAFNHSLDPFISDDLADGKLYGRFEISPAFLDIDKISPGPTATPARSDCSNAAERACGRWITIPLTDAAVKDINASEGLWGMGWNMVSVTHSKSKTSVREFLFFGAHMDTSPSKTSLLPDYIKPIPRLILEYKKPESNPGKE